MTSTTRQRILRANALYLMIAAFGGLLTDIAGAFFAAGPESQILAIQPVAAFGYLEAHGLALIIGVLFWRAAPLRSWHLGAVAVHVLPARLISSFGNSSPLWITWLRATSRPLCTGSSSCFSFSRPVQQNVRIRFEVILASLKVMVPTNRQSQLRNRVRNDTLSPRIRKRK